MIVKQKKFIFTMREFLRPLVLMFFLALISWIQFFYIPYSHQLILALQKHSANNALIKNIHPIALHNKELATKIESLKNEVALYSDSEKQNRTQERLFFILAKAAEHNLDVKKSEIIYQLTDGAIQKNIIHFSLAGSLQQFAAFIKQIVQLRHMSCSSIQCTKENDLRYSFTLDIPIECLKKTLQPRTS